MQSRHGFNRAAEQCLQIPGGRRAPDQLSGAAVAPRLACANRGPNVEKNHENRCGAGHTRPAVISRRATVVDGSHFLDTTGSLCRRIGMAYCALVLLLLSELYATVA